MWPSTSDSARRIAQSSRASPGGNEARAGHLHAALGVDVDAGLFGVGRAGQDHVGAMRAAIAMRADIDDEGARRDVDLIGAEQEQHIERRRRSPFASRSCPPSPGNEADVERADARGRSVQHAEAVPAVLHRAKFDGELAPRARRSRAPSVAHQRALADDDQRRSRLFQRVGKSVLPDSSSASVSGPAPRYS